ncbi:MAG TPA: GAF domain-containing sensor histidine kinase [Longimicrobiales bacterium]
MASGPSGRPPGWKNRSRFLAEASRVFGATLEPGEILERLARLVVPELADWSIVDIVEAGTVRRAAVAHADSAAAPLAEAMRRSAPPRDKRNPIARTLEEGSARILRHVTADTLVDTAAAAGGGGAAVADRRGADAGAIAPRAAMMVPLRARGQVAGVLTLLAKPSRLYRRDDLALTEELADRASLALENARLYAEARRATRVRDEMLAIVSHDLRNPLHTIELSAGLLEAITPRDAETSRKQLEIVKRSVQRADRLIADLLDVARLEAGTFPLECGPVASLDVAREALELHRGQAEKEDERLVAALPERLPDVWADRDRLLQVFSNLLGNAIKFTPKGGRIELGAEAAGEHIRFWVRDTGSGIPADQLPHVFDPFWQAKRRHGGAGLGLAIARGIVEAHGGRIRVESEPGVGTTVWFTIPTVEAARRTPAGSGNGHAA